jgi:hypothetical protein
MPETGLALIADIHGNRWALDTVMAGSPHARYAILHRNDAGRGVDLIAVPYDWEVAVAEARRNGRPDRAAWIASGRETHPA